MSSTVQLISLNEGPDILLDKPILLFGRHPECDVLLNSKKISRKHCCIAVVGDGLIVRDLGSTNGVKINGQKVTEGVLKIGDELMIGTFNYKISLISGPKSRSKLQDDNLDRTINESD
ncbi:FHA domain-containing protein [Telmatocola sphagniphila]|jgi:pSer/pThr/pTyr-binding forkhead associated (FHA) protein|uniref:FHA domain-containing protein n=1 Tax=Telmatocola sphagniphila TaxID=1123043 RepID=A0A8E6B1K1_9BACT|nr:FHA domain-containing protein [Telmatocola sphagniphila]QVL30133.1 FHA domain-containing protein [Telmatocola sphagniphila]